MLTLHHCAVNWHSVGETSGRGKCDLTETRLTYIADREGGIDDLFVEASVPSAEPNGSSAFSTAIDCSSLVDVVRVEI